MAQRSRYELQSTKITYTFKLGKYCGVKKWPSMIQGKDTAHTPVNTTFRQGATVTHLLAHNLQSLT